MLEVTLTKTEGCIECRDTGYQWEYSVLIDAYRAVGRCPCGHVSEFYRNTPITYALHRGPHDKNAVWAPRTSVVARFTLPPPSVSARILDARITRRIRAALAKGHLMVYVFGNALARFLFGCGMG